MGGDLRCDHSLPDVVDIRKRQVLRRCEVAQEVRSVLGRHGPSDRSDDVVVAGGDIGHQRTEDVEGRIVAEPLLQPHVHGDLVQRDVPGTLHHALDAGLAGPQDQMAQRHQLGELRLVGGVVDAPGPEAVPEGQRELVLAGHLQEVVEVLVERVLLLVVEDPRRQERTAAGHHVGGPAGPLEPSDALLGDAAVDGHEVHAVLRMLLDSVEDVVLGHLDHGVPPRGGEPGLVDRDRAHHHGAFLQ